jgi:chemotaxis protein MotB
MSSEPCECEQGLPDWIMSYADMITILMAFFVVMYSMAGTPDKSKEEAIFKSLREQFGPMMPGWAALGRGPFAQNGAQLARLAGSGSAKLRNKNKGGADTQASRGEFPKVQVPRPLEQGATAAIVYFADGASNLTTEQEKQLQFTAEELGGKPQRIEVRGHTSRRPVAAGAPFRDNWDLAYSRCRHTMEYLVSLGIDPKRFRLSVAGENEPISGGGEIAQRGLNSRVELTLLNEVVEDAGSRAATKNEPAKDGESISRPITSGNE